MARNKTWNTIVSTTVQDLFVLLGFELETTMSSNIGYLPPPGGCESSGDAFARTGFVSGCRSGAHHSTAIPAPVMPRDYQRGSNAKTGVRSYHNPHHQGKGECPQNLAAHQEQDEHGKESQAASQDRSRKSLIDRLVNNVGKRLLAEQTIVFADAIEDDDGVIHRITNEGEQGRDDRERNFEVQNREKAQCNEHIVKHGENSGRAEDPLEAERDIDQHSR